MTIGVGMLGSGFMAHTYAECLARHVTGAELRAIACGTRAPALAQEYGVALVPDERALLARPDIEMVIMLSSMLHSIGVGNMLPSWVRLVCVDINPAVVTKLSDRGSTQTIGIVTDVGLFLRQLAEKLR